jgi:hypothetical protein
MGRSAFFGASVGSFGSVDALCRVDRLSVVSVLFGASARS